MNPASFFQRLGESAKYLSSPNPCVACVIHNVRWQLLGHTQPRGGPHAEIMALRAAAAQGIDVRGATVHVSLEPCAHQGRTPPCTQALIAAGVNKVVVAILDPNPLVAGKGVQQLRDAGIEVEVLPVDSTEAVASRELNIGFFSRMIRRVPWVRMKVAASLDGQTALIDGQSQWITSTAAREDGQGFRARSCAVLTGIGTVLADDPLLNVRALVDTPQGKLPAPRQPHLVIVDSKLELPLEAKLLSTLGQRGTASALYPQETVDMIVPRAIYVYYAVDHPAKRAALEKLGVKCISMPEKESDKVDLPAMMQDLAQVREINELHVEAGHKLNGSLLRAGVVDELVLYMAPKLLGPGRGLANLQALPGLDALPASQQLEFKSVQLMGDAPRQDLRIIARVAGRDKF
jgi:diaminohydroxyphosphoribosylaminopyrimidine deaminase / 5-amino-6-(5-phosphoribosylamino)uracil reductase